MKELSIEEKAKAYDNLLVKLQKAKVDNDVCDERYCCVIDDIVPELKESKDERIRKALIDYFDDANKADENPLQSYGVHTDKAIAWLEKQGNKPQVRTGLEWCNTIDDACDKRYAEEYADGEYCHEQSFKWGFQEGVKWLEKQGSKVSAIEGFETEFERQVSYLIASVISKEYEYNQGYVKWTANALLNYAKHELEKQGEQKPAWSEEDDQYLLVCKNALAKYQTTDKWDASVIYRWLENKLKSLRPQKHYRVKSRLKY